MPTHSNELLGLSQIGKTKNQPSKKLETFPNRHPGRDYIVTLTTDEFSCLCPATGQPDTAKIKIRYIPEKVIVESKSLKMYFWSFRDEGIFHEHVSNTILDDLVNILSPKWCEVIGKFSIRGGITISVQAEHNSQYRPAS